jgi:hypothetical protein
VLTQLRDHLVHGQELPPQVAVQDGYPLAIAFCEASATSTRTSRSATPSAPTSRRSGTPREGDRLEARFMHGVLTITIPKSEESKPRLIDVKSAS